MQFRNSLTAVFLGHAGGDLYSPPRLADATDTVGSPAGVGEQLAHLGIGAPRLTKLVSCTGRSCAPRAMWAAQIDHHTATLDAGHGHCIDAECPHLRRRQSGGGGASHARVRRQVFHPCKECLRARDGRACASRRTEEVGSS